MLSLEALAWIFHTRFCRAAAADASARAVGFEGAFSVFALGRANFPLTPDAACYASPTFAGHYPMPDCPGFATGTRRSITARSSCWNG